MDPDKRFRKPSKVLQELLSSLGHDRQMEKEVLELVHENGYDPARITLQELRNVVASFTRKLFLKRS